MASSAVAVRPDGRPTAAAVARWLGALVLLGVGLDHLEQYSVDSYSAIPTIGTLFSLLVLEISAVLLLVTFLAANGLGVATAGRRAGR
jgi:hypothetical protein